MPLHQLSLHFIFPRRAFPHPRGDQVGVRFERYAAHAFRRVPSLGWSADGGPLSEFFFPLETCERQIFLAPNNVCVFPSFIQVRRPRLPPVFSDSQGSSPSLSKRRCACFGLSTVSFVRNFTSCVLFRTAFLTRARIRRVKSSRVQNSVPPPVESTCIFFSNGIGVFPAVFFFGLALPAVIVSLQQ